MWTRIILGKRALLSISTFIFHSPYCHCTYWQCLIESVCVWWRGRLWTRGQTSASSRRGLERTQAVPVRLRLLQPQGQSDQPIFPSFFYSYWHLSQGHVLFLLNLSFRNRCIILHWLDKRTLISYKKSTPCNFFFRNILLMTYLIECLLNKFYSYNLIYVFPE